MADPVKNRLLEAYTTEAGPEFASRFEPVALPFKSTLFRQGERPKYVHFITSGLSSLLATLSEGSEVEVSMTSQEGFPEAIFLLGPETAQRDCMMQVGGTGLRMPFFEFENAFHTDEVLRRLVLRLVQFQSFMSSQLVACNGQHDAEERLARWLLMVQDRVHEPELPLTQEFLGQMLGSRRSTVTLAASNLQRAGIIEYRRGHIKVLDRERLIDTACECYGAISELRQKLYKR
jgi:CRP-like cAMP-binding protein